MPALLTAAELAAHLSVPVGYVYRLTSERRIPVVKLGHRTVRYDLEQVIAALDRPARSPTPCRAPRPRTEPAPTRDLPAYDWSSPMVAGGSLPPADRRG